MENVLIPNFVHNKGLSCAEKMVFAYIYKRIGNVETPSVAISTRDISKFVELKNNSVTLITRKLECVGLISREIIWGKDQHSGERIKQIRYSLPQQNLFNQKQQ